jgi:guanine deaminase
MDRLPFAVSATFMHTPDRGAVEALADALVIVDAAGRIDRVVPAQAGDRWDLAEAFAARGQLISYGPGQCVLPGLVDLHIHAPQWPQLGKALDLPLDRWLQELVFPLEARYADLDFAGRMYESLVDTLLANGTTTGLYFATIHLAASRRLAELCLAKGQRALVGRVAMDDPEQCPDFYRDASAEQAAAETRAFIDFVRAMPGNAHGLVRPVVTPRFIPACTDALLHALGAIAAETDCRVQTHCSEGDWEHGFVTDRCGQSDAFALKDFGLLTRHTVLAHANFVSDADMELIGGIGAGIAHCPLSNAYFANAVFPLRDALDRGLHVGLGTDIAAGASPSIFENIRSAVTVSRLLEDGVDPALPAGERGRPGTRVDFREAFWAATVGGGKALDLPIGLFRPGYVFDALLIDMERPDGNILVFEQDSLDDRLQKIVYNVQRTNIRRVWVDGVVVKDAA